jgi:uncharacterized glyoxalase superfamily protein PhnB
MLTGQATVLLVESVQRAADYYRDRLGFTVEVYDEEPDTDDVDALHAELKDRGAKIIQAPTDRTYGLREFRVQDPDGYILGFGKRIS